MGLLTGVMDDRGKFIYISEEELLKVKKFIEQRGRVSIAELAKHSNELISLSPTTDLSLNQELVTNQIKNFNTKKINFFYLFL